LDYGLIPGSVKIEFWKIFSRPAKIPSKREALFMCGVRLICFFK